MSKLHAPPPAKLFLSLIFQECPKSAISPEANGALSAMKAVFGAPDLCSPPMAFDSTGYYKKEMGPQLWRLAASFTPLVSPENLFEIKLCTATLEKQFADASGRRRVNMDPGLISAGNLILATGKHSPHRIYLRQGVYAELTLLYRYGKWSTLPWTYPDYAGPELQLWLSLMRDQFLKDLRGARSASR